MYNICDESFKIVSRNNGLRIVYNVDSAKSNVIDFKDYVYAIAVKGF